MKRRLYTLMFGRRRPDPAINAIVDNAITTILRAEHDLCLNVTTPTPDGGWICNLPYNHPGAHTATHHGVVLRVWENDLTPPHGIPRPSLTDESNL